MNDTKVMMGNIKGMGRIIVQIVKCNEINENLKKKLINLDQMMEPFNKVTKYADGFDECLSEIQRRKERIKEVNEYMANVSKVLKDEKERELQKRQDFQNKYNDSVIPNLMPFLLKTKEDKNIGTLSVNLPPDEDLPNYKHEDEFEIVVTDDSKDNIKKLELKNKTLQDKFSEILQSSTTGPYNTSEKKLQETDNEISMNKQLIDEEKSNNNKLKDLLNNLMLKQSELLDSKNDIENQIKNIEFIGEYIKNN